jgi:hypothetical protein
MMALGEGARGVAPAVVAGLMVVAGAMACSRPAPAMTVSPHESLQSGNQVEVSARGLDPSGTYDLAQCLGTGSCERGTAVTADPAGRVRATFTVRNQFYPQWSSTQPGPPPTVVCRLGPNVPVQDCRLALRKVSAGTAPVVVASAPLAFRADPPALFPPRRDVVGGEVLPVSIGELPVGATYRIQWCRTACDDSVVTATVADNGRLNAGVVARPRVRTTASDGTVTVEPCYDRCEIRVVVDDRTTLRGHVQFATTAMAMSPPRLDLTATADHLVTGYGFTPDEDYRLVLYGATAVPVGTVRTDGTGGFTTTLTLTAEVSTAACAGYQCRLDITPAAPGSPVSYSRYLDPSA